MYRKLKIFLLQSFIESKRRVKDEELDSPIISLSAAKITFQHPILMDARELGIIEFDSGGFYFKRRYLSMSIPDFQKELSTF